MKNTDQQFDAEDPRLTAYAFGELAGDEAEAIESLLQRCPEAQAELKAIRSTAALLEKELGTSDGLALTEQQRDEVLSAGKVIPTEPDTFRKVSRVLGVTGIAACLVGVSAIGIKQMFEEERTAVEAAGESAEAGVPAETDKSLTRRQVADGPGEGAELEESLIEEERLTDTRSVEDADGLDRSAAMAFAEKPANSARDGDLTLAADAFPSDPAGAKRGGSEPAPTAAPVPDSVSATVPSASGETAARNAGAPLAEDAKVGREMAEAFRRTASPPKPQAAAATSPAVGGVPPSEGNTFGYDEADAAAIAGFGEGTGAGFGSGGVGLGGAAPSPKPRSRALFGRAKEKAEPAGGRGRSRAASPPVSVSPEKKSVAGEDYGRLYDTPFVEAFTQPLSTFAVDVDTASYANVRRFLAGRGQLPPRDAVRVEEMINYFDYDYPEPDGEHPFAVDVEVASCPWAREHRLVRVGLKGKSMAPDRRPPSNLVFLVDVSGSMRGDDKLPLLKTSLAALVRNLNEDDRIGIVTYAGSAGVAMEPKHGDQKQQIIDAIDALRAGGSTNGAGGIELAYKLAKENFVVGGTNRIVLATDGDFNVGTTDTDALIDVVKAKAAEDKIFLTVLGFGQGNLKEHRMEQIANKGDGNYYYVDSAKEGRRVLVDKLSGTLVTIAKDVKIQADFNPARVHSYRLLGYANRRLEAKDFRDDKKDAGEIGAGHTVTALYEIIPAGTEAARAELAATASRYVRKGDAEAKAAALIDSEELLAINVRYKTPDAELEDGATEFFVPLVDAGKAWTDTGSDFRFAAAVGGFGMVLRQSEYRGECSYDLILELAGEGVGDDPNGLRAEFLELVEKAKAISGQ